MRLARVAGVRHLRPVIHRKGLEENFKRIGRNVLYEDNQAWELDGIPVASGRQ